MKLRRLLIRKLTCYCLIHASVAASVFAAMPRPPEHVSWAAAKMDSAIEGRIDKAVAKAIDDGKMSGCVVLIGQREGIAQPLG